MKTKTKQFLSFLLSIALVFGLLQGMSTAVYADNSVTIDFTAKGYTDKQEFDGITVTENGVSVTFNKADGTTSPKYYNTGKAIRLYGQNTMTISTTVADMTSIEFLFGSGEGGNNIIASTGDYYSGTWRGSAKNVTFTIDGSSGHRRLQKLTVSTVSSSATTYSVTYDANGGTGTMTDSSSPYESGATVNVLANGFTAPENKEFAGFKIGEGETIYANESDGITGAASSFTISEDTTLTAQWTESESSYSVTVTPGSNMTKTAGSGAESQTGLSGAMTPVVYTANEGYYFPENYSVTAVNGISVTRNSYTQINVSGTPTADATITLTAPTAKTTPDAPITAAATDCTTADNNDGKLTGVTTAMEYKKSDAESWTVGTGSDITGLVPGTYYVRVKATDTTNASTNQELTIKGFISYTVSFKVVNGKWNEGEGDAATADKTVTLTGHDGDTLKLTADQIPAVGSKPNDTYKAGSWDTTPSADTVITGATTYTYTYAQKDSISQTVTFKVINGKWDDDTTADKTVTLTGYEGDTLKLAAEQIPAVGTKPNDKYEAGSWDKTPSADTVITEATTYTYTYVAKEASAVTKAPEAKTLTYNGQAQELVTAGTATGGEMQYAIGTKDAATQPYTTSIPTATDAGTYNVWYKVVGDEIHKDTDPQKVSVTISQRSIEDGFIIFNDLDDPDLPEYYYTGQDITVTAEQIELYIEETDQYYYIQKNEFEVVTENSQLTGKALGTYEVLVKAKEDSNFTGNLDGEWYIVKGEPIITTLPTASDITYGESLEASTLTGGVAQSVGVDVPGKFVWYDPETVPEVDESGKAIFDIVFIPDDTENFYGSFSMVVPEGVTDDRARVALKVNPSEKLYSQIILDISNDENENGTINLKDHIIAKDEFKNFEIVDLDLDEASASDVHLKDAIILDTTDIVENKLLSYKLSKTVTPESQAAIRIFFDNSNYEAREVCIIVTAKREIVSDELVLENVMNLEYTGFTLKQPDLKVYSSGRLLEELKDYTVTYANNKNAGTATITVKGMGNYKGTVKDTFKIYPADIGDDDFEAADIYLTYTGQNQKKTPVLKRYGKKIAKSNYKVEYYEAGTTLDTVNPKPATDFKNSYVIILSGKGKNFDPDGKRLVNVTITAKDIALAKQAKVKLDKTSYVLKDYPDGEVVPKIVSVKASGKTFTEGKDFTVVISNNTEIGTGKLEIIGNGTTLSGTKTVSFKIVGTTINTATLSGVAASTAFDPSYEDGVRIFGYKLTLDGKELEEGTDYKVSYKSNKKIGTATITFTGIGSYKGTKSKTFKITKAQLYDSEDEDDDCYINTFYMASYNKGGGRPYLEIIYRGVTLVEGVDYTVSYKNNKEATKKFTDETASIMTIKGKGNYTGTITKEYWVIGKFITDQTFDITVTDKNYKLSSNKAISTILQVPSAADSFTGAKVKNNVDYELNYYISTDGTNYKFLLGSDKTMNLRSYLDKNYKDFDYNANGIYIKAELVFEKGYEGTVAAIYRVTDNTLSSVKSKVTKQIYTGDEITFDPTAKDFAENFIIYKGSKITNSSRLVYGTDYEIVEDSYLNNVKKGTASVKIRGVGKYSGTKTIKFKIVKKNL